MTKLNILSTAHHWTSNDPNPITRDIVSSLINSGDEKAILALMVPRVAFGTAGLRAKMAPGYAAINDLTVLQTTLGLIECLKSNVFMTPSSSAELAVVIGFDHRAEPSFNISSRKLASISAAILIKANIRVHFFNVFVSTPMVPFAVNRLKASCGIMFTASHNPKAYNGMKIYGPNGCLIISPTDVLISEAILRNLDVTGFQPDNELIADPLLATELCSDPTIKIFSAYNETIAAMALRLRNSFSLTDRKKNSSSARVAYTAMHGVGTPFVLTAFDAAGLPAPYVVSTQCSPDPGFPTVSFPNPEEGLKVLKHAFATAELMGATIVLANDPDADRLAVAERLPITGDWHVFTGNEIGVLLADFLHPSVLKAAITEGITELVALNTLVSSRMLSAWASYVSTDLVKTRVEITQTGFKNLGNKMYSLNSIINDSNSTPKAFFSYEEAIGFVCDAKNLSDKDGVSAAVCMAMLAAKESPYQRMRKLYLEVGYFRQNNGYVSTEGYKTGIQAEVFSRLEKYDKDGASMPKTLGNRRVLKAERVAADMFIFQIECVSPKPEIASLAPCSLTLRSSGTEPKLKYYAELQINWCGKSSISDENKITEMEDIANSVLSDIISICKETWLNFNTIL